jgi:PAS domain S-box-containing protein
VLVSATLAACVLLRWFLDPWLGDHLPLATLYGAVALAVWMAGYRAAIAVTFTGYILCNYLFIPPRGELTLVFPRDVAGIIVCLFSSGIIIALGEAMRASRRRAQHSVEQLQIVARGMRAPVTRCSRDLEYTWVNKAYSDWLGRPADEITGRPIADVIGPQAFAQLLPYFQRVLNGELITYEEQVSFPGLGPRWISATYSPTYDDTGICDGWVAVVIDIEDRKESEVKLQAAQNALMLVNESLRRRQESYELVVAGAEAAIWEWDIPNKRVDYSPRWKQMRGYGLDEISDREEEWSEGIHPDDRERVFAAVTDHLEGRTLVFTAEYRVRCKDGSWMWIYDRGLAKRDASGRVVRMAGSEVDITERKQAEQALRESEERFRTMADLSPNIIWVTDAKGGIEFINQAYRDVCGITDDDVRNDGWQMVIHPEDNEYVSEFMRCVAERDVFRANCRIRRADGEWRWIASFGAPRFSSAGEFLGHVGSSADVHDLMRSEEALREADRRKDEFLAILAHELRNPLAPIGYATHVLGKQDLTESDLNWVRGVLERQVQQMGRLLDDLLDVSRITRGTFELRKERVSLRSVLNDAIESSRPLIEKSGHMLAIDIPADPVSLDADPTRLAQVFLNLLNNAAKYTERGGSIGLTARLDGGHVTVGVRDNGIGIPPEMLSRVFEMFAQEDRSLERSHGGLGIGLTLAHRLVTMHGGTIRARSDGRGCGSEFTVRLPVAAAQESDTPVPVQDATLATPLRVLVADDNRDSVNGMARLFTSLGHVVCTAFDGRAAVEQAAEFRPGLVILDIGMPKMNGYDAAAEIRRLFGSDVVLAALTGWGQDEDRRRSREAGFDHHLTKPAGVEKLTALIESTNRKGMSRAAHLDDARNLKRAAPDSRGASAVQ